MNLTPQSILLLALEAFGGEIEGRTLLQKRLYFLEFILRARHRAEPELGYDALYYGPYSPTVADATATLVARGSIEESCMDFGRAGASGFEVKRYRFKLTDSAKRSAAALRQRFPDEAAVIGEAIAELKAAGELDYQDLSFAAKAHWVLLNAKEPLSLDAMQREAKRLYRWEVTQPQVKRGYEFLTQLNLLPKPKASAAAKTARTK